MRFDSISKKRYFGECIGILLFVVFAGTFMYSNASSTTRLKPIMYQGRLTDLDYVPVGDGAKNMKFLIYNNLTAGTCKWATGSCGTPLPVSVDVSRGIFSVLLGSGAANNPAFTYDFSDTNVYLEVQIEKADLSSYESLVPRIPVVAASYSLNAQELQGYAPTEFVIKSNGNIRETGTASIDLTGSIDPAASTTVTGVGTLFLTELAVGDRLRVSDEVRRVTAIASNISLTVASAFTDNANDPSPTATRFEFALSSSDVAHGITNLADTNAFFSVSPLNGGVVSSGGALLTGISDSDGPGLRIRSINGATSPSSPALYVTGAKKSGTTIQDLANTEPLLYVSNNDSLVMTLLGSGNLGIGDVTPASLFTVGDGDLFRVNTNGSITITQSVVSGGQGTLAITPGDHTNVTAEVIDFLVGGHTNTLTGGYATQRFNTFRMPLVTAAALQTITNASTVTIAGPPDALSAAAITTAIGLRITPGLDQPWIGTNVTNAYGLYVDAPGIGAGRYAAYFNGSVGIGTAAPDTTLDLSGTLSYTPSATQTLAAADRLAANAAVVKVAGNGGAVQLAVTENSILDGADGQILHIIGTSNANTVELQDDTQYVNSNIMLGVATSRTLGAGDVLTLVYDSTTGKWLEVSFTSN